MCLDIRIRIAFWAVHQKLTDELFCYLFFFPRFACEKTLVVSTSTNLKDRLNSTKVYG